MSGRKERFGNIWGKLVSSASARRKHVGALTAFSRRENAGWLARAAEFATILAPSAEAR